MGGKSKSSQSTSNHQQTTNVVNDGTYAGAEDVVIDESRTDIDDSYNTDNSVRNEFEDSFNTDNSVSYEDAFNTDNSIENEGDYAGNHGNITFVDAGAIAAAESIAERALKEATASADKAAQTSQAAITANAQVTGDAFDAYEHIADEAFEFGTDALGEVSTVAVSAIEEVRGFGNEAIDSLTDQSADYAEHLDAVTQATITSNQNVLANVTASSTNDKALIAELARNTSLAGQDIVAKSSERMTLYMAGAVALEFVVLLFMGRR